MINYKGVNIEREQQLLLKDVSLHIGKGEFVYLIGQVGSGKSSLLKTIYAELPIAEGEASVFEYDLTTLRRRQIPFLRRRLGIIFQDFQLLVDRTVQQNLEFVLKATGWSNKLDIEERIDQVLRLVGMENKGYRMPNTLSGGEQQRIVIARALLNDPAVILADEPTGNLDPTTSSNIVQLLYNICKEHNTTVLMSTHNMQLLEQFPGRVLKVEDGTVTEILSEPAQTEEENANAETIEEAIQESQSETTEAETEEIQIDSVDGSDDSNSAEDHCSLSDNQPEEQSRNEQSDQIPSESASL